MQLFPFNPDPAPSIDQVSPEQRGRAESAPLTVSEAVVLIEGVLESHTPRKMSIVGEVSTFNDRGHCYFTIKDEENVLSCVMWAADAKRCRFTPERGQQVVATGRVGFYGPQGRLQFYVKDLTPVGQGALELAFRQLCDELRGLGYFDESRKKPMPAFPEHIAIITSAASAALQDVIRTARQRWAGIRLSVLDVRVQGDGAAEQVARAVRLLSKQHKSLGIDAVILTRGGGSLEDLWAFNERVVADAIFDCRVPIAVGVGHETDTSIAELVADLRCSTPTQAAARLVPDAEAERQRLDETAGRLTGALGRAGKQARLRLDALVSRPALTRPAQRFDVIRQRLAHVRANLATALHERCSVGLSLDSLGRELKTTIRRSLVSRRERVDGWMHRLGGVGHQSVLQRGYTMTTDRSGALLRSAGAAKKTGMLVTHFSDGKVESTVLDERTNRESLSLFE